MGSAPGAEIDITTLGTSLTNMVPFDIGSSSLATLFGKSQAATRDSTESSSLLCTRITGGSKEREEGRAVATPTRKRGSLQDFFTKAAERAVSINGRKQIEHVSDASTRQATSHACLLSAGDVDDSVLAELPLSIQNEIRQQLCHTQGGSQRVVGNPPAEKRQRQLQSTVVEIDD